MPTGSVATDDQIVDDGVIGQVGLALERAFGVADENPVGF